MTTSTTVTVDDLLANAAWARRLARNLLHDGDSADDLVQETWIAALRAKPDREQPLRPWLGRVLRNHAANRGRDNARREARHQRAGALVAGAAATDPEQLVGRFQVQRLLAELITQLREPNRQTLLLRYYEGLTSEQIGGIMGVAPGTVRSRLKDTIDELRDELDRRHLGDREAWLGALLPLVPPGPATPPPTATADPPPANRAGAQGRDDPARPTVTLPAAGLPVLPARSPAISPVSGLAAVLTIPKLAIGVLVVALAAGGALVLRPSSDAEPPRAGGRAAPGTHQGGGAPRGGGRQLAAVLPATLDQCRQVLAPRRRELAAAEVRYRKVASPSLLLEEGAPNPTARAALLPDLERIVRGDGGAGLSFTLECRTWVCRMLVLQPAASASERQLRAIPTDPILQERLSGHSIAYGAPAKDPVSGATYRETPILMTLKAPSGARIAGFPDPVDPAEAAAPPPVTLAACQSELDAAGRRLLEIRDVGDREALPSQIYRDSPPNPSLTAEFGALVARALPPSGAGPGPEVTCRGTACRVKMPGQSTRDPWRSQLERDPRIAPKISRTSYDGESVYYRVGGPPAQADRMLQNASHFKAIMRSVDLAGCSERFPAAGFLEVKIVFGGREETKRIAQPGWHEVKLGDTLAGTLLGRCVGEQVERAVKAAPFPSFTRGSSSSRYEFPLEPKGAGSSARPPAPRNP